MNSELLKKQKEFLTHSLSGKTIMVSGSTGLIGSSIVRYILDLNDCHGANITVVALYRNEEKRYKVYPKERGDLKCIQYDETNGVTEDICVDYVIHAAGISGGSKMHLSNPIRVFDIGIGGTKRLLDFAVSHGCRGFCFVSTYEIYGQINSEGLIGEDSLCSLDPMILRNSYAEIKRVCEAMLTAYSATYGINVYSGRLSSTFGNGVAYNDPRFFAEFGRCIIENKDIVLKSMGGTVRNYLDSDDAAAAFLFIISKGKNATAYNLTNSNNVYSVMELAEKFVFLSNNMISLVLETTDDIESLGYRQVGRTVIDSRRIEALGWKPVFSIDETIIKMVESMRLSNN